MSVTMAKSEGVTVFTLTSDPESPCPPLCQMLKGICYSHVCCSVSERLRRLQGPSQSALGALHIMVGLLNIGLAVILFCTHHAARWQMEMTGFPFWLGGFFIAFGIVGILSEKFPSPCLVILNVTLNLLAGLAFAIAAIVLYSINVADIWLWICENDDDYSYSYSYGYRHRSTPSPEELIMREKCREGRDAVLMLVRGINGVLIVLSVLELCLVISSAVLGIKALCKSNKRQDESADEPEYYKPLLEEVTSNPTA